MSIKSAVKEWLSEQWEHYIKQPIERQTEQIENSASQQINKYSAQAQAQIRKPKDYYNRQPSFYRGLFWIAIGLLIILWIISGS